MCSFITFLKNMKIIYENNSVNQIMLDEENSEEKRRPKGIKGGSELK